MIAAIPTHYAGRHFRSRLEARWAMFFTLAGYSWDYEVEGFRLSNGMQYLPDFVVRHPKMPHIVRYVEIKPPGVTENEKFDAFQGECNMYDLRDGARTLSNNYWTRGAALLSGGPFDILSCEMTYAAGVTSCPRCGWFRAEWKGRYSWKPPHEDAAVVYCWVCDLDTPCGSGNPVEPGVIAPSEPYKGDLLVESPHHVDILIHRQEMLEAAQQAQAARFGT